MIGEIQIVMPVWRDVKVNKPEPIKQEHFRKNYKPVLLYTKKDDSIYVGWYVGKDYRGVDRYIARTSLNSYQHITRKITHWMPMPELPKQNLVDKSKP